MHSQISSLKNQIDFLREGEKEKIIIITLLRRNSCECKKFESPKLDSISEKNEERHDTWIWTTSNSIHSDNDRQFTKLEKQKRRVKDIQIDSVIRAHPDETTHLTNTEVTFSNINKISHVMNKDNRSSYKERDKLRPTSQNPTKPKKFKTSVFIVGDSMIKKVDG